MQRRVLTGLMVLSLVLGVQAFGNAADLFSGDSAIYGAGGTVDLRPNVLFIVDNSAFMKQGALGEPYDPSVTYGGDYTTNAVYRRISATGGTINYDNPDSPFINDISGVSCTEASSILTQTSYYTGPLQSNGSCRGQTGFYYTGNLLNYITNPPPGSAWENRFYNLGEYVQVTTATGEILYYEVIVAGNSTGSQPTWGASLITDGGITWKRAGSVMDMVKDAIKSVVELARDRAKFGVMVFGNNNKGGQVIASVEKMASDDTLATNGVDGAANLTAFQAEVDSISYVDANTTEPLNSALWDARLYYANQYSSSSARMGTDGPNVASNTSSPVECPDIQPNFVVVLTMGNSYQAGADANTIGNQDAAYNVGDVDDAAKRLYSGNITVTPATPANPQIATTIIKLINDEPRNPTDPSDLSQSALRRAAAYGHGGFYLAQHSSALEEALLETVNNIVLESDTSFVAPVVPTSPENRTYSGQRVYLGFFRPLSKKPWSGNLKKYGINAQNQIVDKNGVVATYESGSQKGNFIPTAKSFWNDLADAGQVEVGGAGEVLLGQSSRSIYTYLGTTPDLNDSANAFVTTNSNILYNTHLGLTNAADRDKLINYIHGKDSWDDDGDLNAAEKRIWIMGDILHSKPMVVNYNQFTFNATNESSCTVNKTMVYVGANDGMIHAIRDCNGEEAWAFIPPGLLPDLKLLPPGLQSQYNPSGAHPYFVDGSPVVYVYDHDDDGNIGSGPETSASDTDPVGVTDNGSADKVILLFGLRRGGNAYYALDVTDPENPQYLWKIDSSTTGFSEMGQTWSMPQLAMIKIDVSGVQTPKVVAFVGGGYDKEEDARYGGATYFPAPPDAERGEGYVISTNTTDPWTTTNRPNARGRAVYAFEVATLDPSSGVPTVPSSPAKIWGFTPANGVTPGNQNSYVAYLLKYAIPSDVTVVDTDYNGYADRLYVGDLNGRMFAFEVGSADVSNWSARNIFYDDRGRKIFYRPSISLEKGGTVLVAFGTGDREHPLNTRIWDAFYVVKDTVPLKTGVNTGATSWQLNYYTALENVTADYLQYDTPPDATQTVSAILARLAAKPGWYINLSRYSPVVGTLGGYGEKVLAAPLIFNKVAYFTTYQPSWTPSTDPCTPGNLGTSRLYAVNYKTGEAVLNFANANTANNNDTESTSNNTRALSATGQVLRKADREITLGVGIPSGLVVLMPPSGDAKLLIGCGGGLCSEDPVVGGTIIPVYWMQW